MEHGPNPGSRSGHRFGAGNLAKILSAGMDLAFGSIEGQTLQRGPALWQILAVGAAGQGLRSGGASALNSWKNQFTKLIDHGNNSGNVSTTSDNAVYVMAGFDAGVHDVTPTVTGNIIIFATGQLDCTSAAGIPAAQLCYGTGTGPAAGAAATGTITGGQQATNGVANFVCPCTWVGIVTGLIIGTNYWVDWQFGDVANLGGAATTTLFNGHMAVLEF